jgi:hypothetical protein
VPSPGNEACDIAATRRAASADPLTDLIQTKEIAPDGAGYVTKSAHFHCSGRFTKILELFFGTST